jgi:hypothetical protein
MYLDMGAGAVGAWQASGPRRGYLKKKITTEKKKLV